MLEKDLTLGQTQWCLVCDEVKPLEQGEAVVRYGSFIEFTCYECKGEPSTEKKAFELLKFAQEHRNDIEDETKFEELMEGISDAIFNAFPNFDNNIQKETWGLMVLSVEEICSQLGKEIK